MNQDIKFLKSYIKLSLVTHKSFHLTTYVFQIVMDSDSTKSDFRVPEINLKKWVDHKFEDSFSSFSPQNFSIIDDFFFKICSGAPSTIDMLYFEKLSNTEKNCENQESKIRFHFMFNCSTHYSMMFSKPEFRYPRIYH